MKKKSFFTGSVFQFYIPEIKQYSFCKFYDFTHIEPIHGLLARAFNKFSKTESNDLDILKNADWLFGHRSIHRWPDLRKDTTWKSLGILSGDDDNVIPDFKGVQAFPDIVEDEASIKPWYPIFNIRERGPNCEYKKVQHLEQIILTPKTGLVKRAGMEYCRLNNLNVDDYYDLNNDGTLNMYYQMINVPVYKDIPKAIRGKALVNQAK